MSWTIYDKKFKIEVDNWGTQEDVRHVLAFDGHGQALLWFNLNTSIELTKNNLLNIEHITTTERGLEALKELL